MSDELLSDKIELNDLALALRVKDVNTAIRWAKRKGISIIKFGKARYINLIDFQLIVDRPLIDSLKIKYPESWQEMYEAYKKNDYITITEIESKRKPLVRPKFVAPGKTGDNFIQKIRDNNK